jgi:xanthine/uracil permease
VNIEVWNDSFQGKEFTPFGKYFFTATTVLVPLIIIFTGFIQKDKKRILIETIMAVAALRTFYYYFTSTPAEVPCIKITGIAFTDQQ